MKASAKTQLLHFLLEAKKSGTSIMPTSQIQKCGVNNFSNRAMRNARELRKEGHLERVSRAELKKMGVNIGELAYRIL